MPKLILYRGLPGCGKTTEAKKLQGTSPGNYKRVNRDDLRDMIDDGKWSPSNEKLVSAIRDILIKAALDRGCNAICDDTNLVPKTMDHLKQLGKLLHAEIEVIDMTDVSVETCIQRDLRRARSVGEAVIRKMYDDFLRPTPPKRERIEGLPECIIVDIDGTVALNTSGRSPFDWHRVGEDDPNEAVCVLIRRMMSEFDPVYVSGRDECCRTITEEWLDKKTGCFTKNTPLFMRPAGDTRDDRIVKREIYEREIKGKYNVLWVLDDRNKVVDMWRRELGLTCLQVAEGNF